MKTKEKLAMLSYSIFKVAISFGSCSGLTQFTEGRNTTRSTDYSDMHKGKALP